jgi:hypothetical protein
VSASSISSSQTQTPPTSYATSDASSSQHAQESKTTDAKADKDGDEVAASQESSRPPLPPGQGTRVDILA